MFILEVEQERYIKNRFVFDDLNDAANMIVMMQQGAAVKTTITLTCTVDPKGEEDDND